MAILWQMQPVALKQTSHADADASARVPNATQMLIDLSFD